MALVVAPFATVMLISAISTSVEFTVVVVPVIVRSPAIVVTEVVPLPMTTSTLSSVACPCITKPS